MNFFLGIPALLVVTMLQAVLAPRITVLQAKPDLVVVVVVAWAVLRGPEAGLIWGAIGGLLLDFLGAAPLGTNLITLSLVGFLSAQARLSMVETNLLLCLVAVFAASILHDLVFMIVLWVTGMPVPIPSNLAMVVLPSAALNTLIVPLFYALFGMVHRRNLPAESASR